MSDHCKWNKSIEKQALLWIADIAYVWYRSVICEVFKFLMTIL